LYVTSRNNGPDNIVAGSLKLSHPTPFFTPYLSLPGDKICTHKARQVGGAAWRRVGTSPSLRMTRGVRITGPKNHNTTNPFPHHKDGLKKKYSFLPWYRSPHIEKPHVHTEGGEEGYWIISKIYRGGVLRRRLGC